MIMDKQEYITNETSKFKFSRITLMDLRENTLGTCSFILANLGKLQRKDPIIITWLVVKLCHALLEAKRLPNQDEDWTPPPPDAL